ncbi:hypothetical protein [Nitrospirillum amazonense]|uniref:hypothetical protein n=1 Tax=Nitrospirillum amazonense TaxID=28077 RepID=UPI0024126FF6|nr:hypothetical protein [Nitrospirillum amazonense]MDG3444509.1 hypothetical protein [Nitrospirillum amazonense]
MQKFARHRSITEIQDACTERKWEFSREKYDREGSDYISFLFQDGEAMLEVVYNTFNGNFLAEARTLTDGLPIDRLITGRDPFDGRPWFDALLNFLYVPQAAEPAQAGAA